MAVEGEAVGAASMGILYTKFQIMNIV